MIERSNLRWVFGGGIWLSILALSVELVNCVHIELITRPISWQAWADSCFGLGMVLF